VIDTAGRNTQDTVEELRRALAMVCPHILADD
jgi:hypothetical protein